MVALRVLNRAPVSKNSYYLSIPDRECTENLTRATHGEYTIDGERVGGER